MKKSEKKTDKIVLDANGLDTDRTIELPRLTETKEVSALDKIKELNLEDQLYPVEPQADFEEGRGIKEIKISVIVFTNDDVKTRLMIKELEQKKHLQIVTTALNKDIVKRLRSEKEVGNLYNIAYVPYTNDDLNKDGNKLRKELEDINKELSIESMNPIVYAYFSDREDVEVNAKARLS